MAFEEILNIHCAKYVDQNALLSSVSHLWLSRLRGLYAPSRTAREEDVQQQEPAPGEEEGAHAATRDRVPGRGTGDSVGKRATPGHTDCVKKWLPPCVEWKSGNCTPL